MRGEAARSLCQGGRGRERCRISSAINLPLSVKGSLCYPSPPDLWTFLLLLMALG